MKGRNLNHLSIFREGNRLPPHLALHQGLPWYWLPPVVTGPQAARNDPGRPPGWRECA